MTINLSDQTVAQFAQPVIYAMGAVVSPRLGFVLLCVSSLIYIFPEAALRLFHGG